MKRHANTNFLKWLPAFFFILILSNRVQAKQWEVGKGHTFSAIKKALSIAKNGDTILVFAGIYKEGNIEITKKVCLFGRENPIIDGESKVEIISIRADSVVVKGFQLQNSGYAVMKDPAAIKIYKSKYVRIEHNVLLNNYFAIYFEYSISCVVKNNFIKASQTTENRAGNGVHCWYCDSMQIIGNKITGQRDGIYFEFVTHSVIW